MIHQVIQILSKYYDLIKQCTFIEFIILLYTFLVISFARYKEYMICLISFSKFSVVLPAFTCARATDNL